MKNILTIILAIFLVGCGQQESPFVPLEEYIQNPPKKDTTCIGDIRRAKAMVENGEIVFCYPFGLGSSELRQEKRLILLCKQHNLTFSYEFFGCVRVEGQRQGCFVAYMDKIIADKFGADFKQKLLAQADSMMVAANDTVLYYLCDEKPKMPYYYENEYFTRRVPIVEELRKQLKSDNEGKFPFMDIGFYIDKEGNASGYFLNHFYDANNKSNQRFKDELFNIGVEQLKQIERWKSGIVNNQKVITKNNVRVYF